MQVSFSSLLLRYFAFNIYSHSTLLSRKSWSKDAVFVISVPTGTEGDFDPSGTAFAITSKHAITVHHNLFDEATGTTFNECILSHRIMKDGQKYSFPNPVCVTLVEFDAYADWAIVQIKEEAMHFTQYFSLETADALSDEQTIFVTACHAACLSNQISEN